jgi:hypothetical protein
MREPEIRGSIYLRLETDQEFRIRMLNRLGWTTYRRDWIGAYSGAELDETVWNHYKAQRRIIEASR